VKNDGIFVATFVFKNGQLPTFFGHLATFEKFLSEFLVKNGQMPTFCPLLKIKMATEKCVNHAGFRGLWPFAHPFSIFYYKKIFKKYINIGKKVAIWPQA
jgi:hypothetical protein